MGPNDNRGDNDRNTDTAKFGGEHHPTSVDRGGPSVTLIAAGIIVAFCIIFFAKNSHEASLHFVFFTKTTTTRWSILMSIVLGIVLDRLVSIWWRRRRRKSHEAKD